MLRNHALSNMAAEDLAALLPSLSEVFAARGDRLQHQCESVDTLYFPVDAYLANTVLLEGGQSALPFVMGAEGVTGLAAFLARQPSSWGVEVRAPGTLYRLPVDAMRRQFDQSPGLRHQLMMLAHDYQAQAAYGVGCSNYHNAPARIATLLLKSADRLGVLALALTQQDLADFLGMQRTTANAAATRLREIGAIRYSRGSILILDRGILETAACECLHATRKVAFHMPPAPDMGLPDLTSREKAMHSDRRASAAR